MSLREHFSKPTVIEVSPEQTKMKQQAGAIILDVRERYQWCDGHIPGAINIPLGSLAKRLQELDASQEIIAVCHRGQRSITAAVILLRAGFTQVSSMAGGMGEWMNHDYPVRAQ